MPIDFNKLFPNRSYRSSSQDAVIDLEHPPLIHNAGKKYRTVWERLGKRFLTHHSTPGHTVGP